MKGENILRPHAVAALAVWLTLANACAAWGTTTTTFTTTTTLAECGNGVQEGAEQCDDGLANSDTTPDACRISCLLPSCGDHVVDTGEECDDGNPTDGDGCDSNCKFTSCGNGIRTGSEQCDDGNVIDGDGCTGACELQICGDGTVQAGETCDDGGASVDCDADCTTPACGDATLNAAAGEQCDDGNTVSNDGCDSECRFQNCTYSIPTSRQMTALAENVWRSAWSPDGKRIAFSRQTGSSARRDIWVVNVDEPLSAPLQLATDGGMQTATDAGSGPAWSADGTHVLYAGGCGIRRVPSDGSGAPEDVVCGAAYPNVNYATSRLFYVVNYSAIRSVALDASGAPQPGTDVTVATGLGAGVAVVQPATVADGDSLSFVRIPTGANLASIVYTLRGVLDILGGATAPPSALSDPRISVLVNEGTFINTGYPSLTGELFYFVDGALPAVNLIGNGASGAMFPGEDVGTDGLPLDPTDENSDDILDQPSAGENNGILDAGEDLGLDGAPLDPFDNSSGEASMISDNDGVTGEPSIGEGNGVLDEALATRLHTVVVRFDGLEPPQVLADGFSVGVSPDGTRLSYLKRTWEGPLGTSKPFLNFDLFVGSVRATCPIKAAVAGSMKDGSGTTLTFPPGALVSDTDITIETPPVDLVPTTPMPLALARIYGPSGLTFDPPATISFHYVDAQIAGFDESSLSLNLYNSSTEQWEALATEVDADANLLSAQVPHFSPVVVWGVALACGDGALDAGEECDDGNYVSHDGCSASCTADCVSNPRSECRAAEVSQLLVKDSESDGEDLLKWKWSRGAATTSSEISDPTEAGRYRVCVYPNGSLNGEIPVPAGSSWESRGEKGYQYTDRSKAAAGLSTIKLRTGGGGQSSILLKAGGEGLPDTLLPAISYSVQMIDVATGICWGSSFEAGKVKDGYFRATMP